MSSGPRGIRQSARDGGPRHHFVCADPSPGRSGCRRLPSATTPILRTLRARGRRTGERLVGRGRSRRDSPRWVVASDQRVRTSRTTMSSTGCVQRRPIDGRPTTCATSARWDSRSASRRRFGPECSSRRSTRRLVSMRRRWTSFRSTCSTTRRSRSRRPLRCHCRPVSAWRPGSIPAAVAHDRHSGLRRARHPPRPPDRSYLRSLY